MYSTPKTAKGVRGIALDASTVEALRAPRKRQAEERLLFGPKYDDNDLLFCEPTGEPLQPKRVHEDVRPAGRDVRTAADPAS